MKPIIKWELAQRKSYLFWWLVGTIGIVALLLLIYPSIHSQADQLNKVLNQLPTTLKDLKTGGSQVDITSPAGYLNSQLYYVTLPLLEIIMAVGLGSSLLAKEEQNRTLELLLARPISRGRLLAAKAIAGTSLLVVVSLVTGLVTIALAKAVNMQISIGYLLLANTYATLFSLSFGAIAYCLTALGASTRRMSIAVSVALGFGGYLLASLSGVSHYIKTPATFLPYHYYNPEQILSGHVTPGLNIYLVGVAILTIVISWLGFKRRDIY